MANHRKSQMLPLTPSGFFATPFTKATLIFTGIASLASNVLAQRNSYNLILPHIAEGQWWRLITHVFAWRSNSEMLFGSIIGYHLRLFERLYGTSKFATFALVTTALTTALQLAWLGLNKSVAAPGPYGFIYATLVQYYFEVPATFYVNIFGIPFSDKMFLYLLAVQLALSNPSASQVSSISGIIAGLIYASGLIPGLQQWRIPSAIQSIFSSIGSSIVSDPIARTSVPNRSETRPQVMDFNEQQIGFLCSMGFRREDVVTALRQTNGDAAAAAELLLSQ
jgi:hypothetical protein